MTLHLLLLCKKQTSGSPGRSYFSTTNPKKRLLSIHQLSNTQPAAARTAQFKATPRLISRKSMYVMFFSLFFHSFVMLNDTSFADDLRMLAANNIAGDPLTYNDAFLGKPNWEYCEWLTKKQHWGGKWITTL